MNENQLGTEGAGGKNPTAANFARKLQYFRPNSKGAKMQVCWGDELQEFEMYVSRFGITKLSPES